MRRPIVFAVVVLASMLLGSGAWLAIVYGAEVAVAHAAAWLLSQW